MNKSICEVSFHCPKPYVVKTKTLFWHSTFIPGQQCLLCPFSRPLGLAPALSITSLAPSCPPSFSSSHWTPSTPLEDPFVGLDLFTIKGKGHMSEIGVVLQHPSGLGHKTLNLCSHGGIVQFWQEALAGTNQLNMLRRLTAFAASYNPLKKTPPPQKKKEYCDQPLDFFLRFDPIPF